MARGEEVPSLEDRVSKLEAGWVEAARVTQKLADELKALQGHVRGCDAAVTSIVLLVTSLEEVFATAGAEVAGG